MIWDASDANPLHRRIPAEVVARRARSKKAGDVAEEVTVDLKAAITLKPEARPKWLSKACSMAAEGKANCTDLYNIIANRKFASGLPRSISKQLGAVVHERLELFSEKQQRFLLSSECPLVVKPDQRGGEGNASPEEDDAEEASPSSPQSAPIVGSSVVLSLSAPAPPPETSRWQVAEDEATQRRLRSAEEAAKKELAKKLEKQRRLEAEESEAKRQQEEEEAAKRRKLEEEADSIFMRAFVPQATVAPEEPRRRSPRSASAKKSRSRSISSRTARRNLRENKARMKRESWRGDTPGALSGSRAILLNRDYMEDLPHMPRNLGGPAGPGRTSSRSRSRDRSRRRRR